MKFTSILNKKITFNISISFWHVLLLLVLIYVVWELYWFDKVDFGFIKWHTHLFSTLLISFIVCAPLILFFKKKNNIAKLNWIYSFIFFAFLTEIVLIIFGFNKNYMEVREGYYQSPYRQVIGNIYNVRQAKVEIDLKSTEFDYKRKTNSLGFSDKEWKIDTQNKKINVFTLGDSFTEGDGAPSDSCYPFLLKKEIANLDSNISVFNAGTGGSDPFFDYMKLKDIVLNYEPNIVLQTISSDDLLYDIPLRGGFERFGDNNNLYRKKGPWWEIIYASSYFYRFVLGVLGFDMNKPYIGSRKKNIENINKIIEDLALKYDSVATKNNIIVYWIIKPLKHETIQNSHVFNYNIFKSKISPLKNSKIIDLLPLYQDYIKQNNSNAKDYYWKIDGHHNSLGYEMMAKSIAKEINI